MKNLLSFKKVNIPGVFQNDGYTLDTSLTEIDHIKDISSVAQTQKRTFYLSVFAILMSCLTLVQVGLKPSDFLQQQIVTVDMNQLIRLKASSLMKEKDQEVSETMKHIHMDEQARNIRLHINTYAKANNVIVVAKGAVFGSTIKDVTDDIAATL